MRRGVLVRLLVNRGLVGDDIARFEKMIEMGFREGSTMTFNNLKRVGEVKTGTIGF
jgi:hypothetical protein